jgi:hypothetical protein
LLFWVFWVKTLPRRQAVVRRALFAWRNDRTGGAVEQFLAIGRGRTIERAAPSEVNATDWLTTSPSHGIVNSASNDDATEEDTQLERNRSQIACQSPFQSAPLSQLGQLQVPAGRVPGWIESRRNKKEFLARASISRVQTATLV